MHNPKRTLINSGLWIPLLILSIAFILSVSYVFWVMKNYKKNTPLIIKPSSIEKPIEAAQALKKALHPLFNEGYGIKIENTDPLFSVAFNSEFKDLNAISDKKLNISFSTIDLNAEPEISTINCYQTALFNMKRKMERKWKNKFYFVICEASKLNLELYYDFKN